MSLSKKRRFEIFKRDGFTCQYCGKRPPDVVLEVDHIDPRANGGGDEEINLVTACFDCNRGKSARRLGDIQPRPDADMAYLEVQQEVAEAKRYLDASRIREELQDSLRIRLEDIWCSLFETEYIPNPPQWKQWLNTFSAEEIESAIKVSIRFNQTKASGETWKLIKYVSGVLWNVRKGATDA